MRLLPKLKHHMRESVGYNANRNIRGEAVSQNVHREGIFDTFILIQEPKTINQRLYSC